MHDLIVDRKYNLCSLQLNSQQSHHQSTRVSRPRPTHQTYIGITHDSKHLIFPQPLFPTSFSQIKRAAGTAADCLWKPTTALGCRAYLGSCRQRNPIRLRVSHPLLKTLRCLPKKRLPRTSIGEESTFSSQRRRRARHPDHGEYARRRDLGAPIWWLGGDLVGGMRRCAREIARLGARARVEYAGRMAAALCER